MLRILVILLVWGHFFHNVYKICYGFLIMKKEKGKIKFNKKESVEISK